MIDEDASVLSLFTCFYMHAFGNFKVMFPPFSHGSPLIDVMFSNFNLWNLIHLIHRFHYYLNRTMALNQVSVLHGLFYLSHIVCFKILLFHAFVVDLFILSYNNISYIYLNSCAWSVIFFFPTRTIYCCIFQYVLLDRKSKMMPFGWLLMFLN